MLSISFLPLFSSGYSFPYERMMPSSEALSIFGRSIHPNAWKGYSRKLDFRFTEFLEAYPPFWSSWAFTPRTSPFPSAPPCVRRALAYPRLRPSPRLSGWLSHPPCVQRAGADLPQKLSLRLPFARGPHVQPRDPCRSAPEAYPSSSLPLFALLVGILRSPRSHNRLTPWISLKAKTPWMASTPWTEGSLPSCRAGGAAGRRPSRSSS